MDLEETYMTIDNKLLEGYENTTLIKYEDIDETFPNSFYYEDIYKNQISGVLKANRYVNGRLLQTYSTRENHVSVVAATRLGKTTGYVIPQIISFLKQKMKRNMIVSDPKGELYRITSETARQEGYKVLLINYCDFKHSEYFNEITYIYDMFQEAMKNKRKVEVVSFPNGAVKYRYDGKLYLLKSEADAAANEAIVAALDEIDGEITEYASAIITVDNDNDPYWEMGARGTLIALLWGMLEDSVEPADREKITREKFSISTALKIMSCMRDEGGSTYNDNGYFTSRATNSRSYLYAKNNFIENAPNTRKCIISAFNNKVLPYKASAARIITSCCSFKLEELVSDTPTILYIAYKDESKSNYQLISNFIQRAYRFLIGHARKNGESLSRPFYFILDEFANFPKIKDFEVTIAACASRNIWFVLVLQSYSQLNAVYGANIANVIKQNMNVHVFVGSNDPETLKSFSEECGEITRISPLSALNGSKNEIDNYVIETIPLMPKSRLASLKEGECIVTEANSGYVLFSKMERYYKCDEFNHLPLSKIEDYVSEVNPFDTKYIYVGTKLRSRRSWYDD